MGRLKARVGNVLERLAVAKVRSRCPERGAPDRRINEAPRLVRGLFFDHNPRCPTLACMNRSVYRRGLLSVAVQLSALNTWAQANNVQYVAPAGCPSADVFEEAVTARGGNVKAVAADAPQSQAQVRLFVRVEQDAAGFEGRVSAQQDGAAAKARTARSTRCEEVVDAMALVTALTLENEPEPAAEPSVQPETAVPVAATAPPKEPVAHPKVFAGSTPLRFNVHDALRVESGTVHVDGLKTLTLAGGALFGVLPGVVLPRISATLITTQFLTLPNGSQSLVGAIPLMRLSYLGPGQWRRGANHVELDGFLGGAGAGLTLGVCTTPHFNSNGWAFLTCAEMGGKILSLRSTQGDDVASERAAPFLDFALSVSAQYHFNPYLHAALAAEGGAQVGESKVFAGADAPAVSVGTAVGSITFGLGLLF